MYYRGFDGLRAISVILVLIAHLGVQQMIPTQYVNHAWPLISGYTGVRIFFVISGFLITTLLIAEKTTYAKISYKNFIIRRGLRIVPCFLMFLTVIYLLGQAGAIKATAIALLWSALYAYNFVSLENYTNELAHTWSLAVEEHFYLFWPLLISLVTVHRSLIVALILILICGALTQFLLVHPTFAQNWFPERWTIPGIGPILIGCSFAIINQTWSRAAIAFRHPFTISLSAILYCASIWLPVGLHGIHFLIQSTGIGLALVWLIHRPSSMMTRGLEVRFLRYVGQISYGIYIWQGLFLTNGPTGTLWIQQFPQNLMLTFLVATLSFYVIEKPCLRFKDMRFTADSLRQKT